MKIHREQKIAIQKAYDLLREYEAEVMDREGEESDKARWIRNAAKMLWLSLMPSAPPWTDGPACDHPGEQTKRRR